VTLERRLMAEWLGTFSLLAMWFFRWLPEETPDA